MNHCYILQDKLFLVNFTQYKIIQLCYRVGTSVSSSILAAGAYPGSKCPLNLRPPAVKIPLRDIADNTAQAIG